MAGEVAVVLTQTEKERAIDAERKLLVNKAVLFGPSPPFPRASPVYYLVTGEVHHTARSQKCTWWRFRLMALESSRMIVRLALPRRVKANNEL